MNKGFAALTSVIIISAILLVTLTTSSSILFSLQYKNLYRINKMQARLSAESCLDYALFRLVQNPSFTISAPYNLQLSNGTCIIDNIANVAPRYTIKSNAKVGKASAYLTATLNLTDINNPTLEHFSVE
ncbi:MAG: hypothetical protein EXS50_00885 [Candidatus Taylorbacteria bacterium]|nr:hypothetical protein [Candidatus Taylorbacteria bacterium]